MPFFPHALFEVPVLQPPVPQQPAHVAAEHAGAPQMPMLQELPMGQGEHCPPMVPQNEADCIENVLHFPPLQQPCGQLAGEQTGVPLHEPFTHDSPGPQLLQTLPPEPQLVGVCTAGVRHTFPEQQPAHVPELQLATGLHFPKKQPWPAGHAAQVMPAMPHAAADCCAVLTQTPLRQQPWGQLAAVHALLTQLPAWQVWFAWHDAQTRPLVPQRVWVLPG